jgi:hypothetical protein
LGALHFRRQPLFFNGEIDMNLRRTYLTTWSVSVTALLGVGIVAYLMTGRVSAKEKDDPVITAIQNLQNSVVGLQSTVNTLQTRIDALSPPEQSNVRWTPIVSVQQEAISCWVLNVSTSSRSVRIQLIRYLDGASILDATLPVPAGSVNAASQAFPALTGYCKFTVVDGERSDIRANIEVRDPNYSTSFLSVPAE